MEIGERNRDLEDFEHKAKTTEDYLNNKDLNPKPMNWKQKLGALVGIGALTVAGGAVLKEAKDANSNPDWFEQPISGTTLEVELNKVEDNMKNLVGPTFREDAKGSAEELTPEKLNERGIDISSGKVTIKEVKGATYPSASHKGDEVDDKGNRYGVWGEIQVPDPSSGEMKGTGIFMSRNQYQPVPPPQESSQE